MTFADEDVPEEALMDEAVTGAAGDAFEADGTDSAAGCGGGSGRTACSSDACGVGENFALFPVGAFVFFRCGTGGADDAFGGESSGGAIGGDNETCGCSGDVFGAGRCCGATSSSAGVGGEGAAGSGCGNAGIGGASESWGVGKDICGDGSAGGAADSGAGGGAGVAAG